MKFMVTADECLNALPIAVEGTYLLLLLLLLLLHKFNAQSNLYSIQSENEKFRLESWRTELCVQFCVVRAGYSPR